MIMVLLFSLALLLLQLGGADCFLLVPRVRVVTVTDRINGERCFERTFSILNEKEDDEEVEENDDDQLLSDGSIDDRNMMDDDEKIFESQQDEPSTLSDLTWRVEKLRLEEANTRRFLKARPRFLPYEDCRKWVIAWNRWDTEEDWKNWIDEGEKRNSYIPARPDEYYSRMGKWQGWDHFLGKTNGEDFVNEESPAEKNQNLDHTENDDAERNDDIGDFQ